MPLFRKERTKNGDGVVGGGDRAGGPDDGLGGLVQDDQVAIAKNGELG